MREQMALHTYKQQVTIEAPKRALPTMKRGFHEAVTEPKPEKGPREAAARSRRVVTVTPQVDPSTAWQTFAQRRRTRSKTQRIARPVPRTLAQTGMRASSGRMKAIRRPLPTRHHSPVPVRSGRQRPRRGFFWKLVGLVALGLCVCLLTGFVLTGSAFRIAQVNVVGTQNDALIRSIQHMGMQEQNIFLLNVAALEERIDASPLVASAALSKQLPNQLTVNVVERVPVLLWQTSQGTYSVDNQGMVIASAASADMVGRLGTVVDITNQGKKQSGQAIHPGAHLDRTTVAFAAAIFQRMPEVTGINLFKLHYDGTMYASTTDDFDKASGRGAFILESSQGWQAYLGGAHDANPLDNRLIELQQVLQLAQKQQLNLATIDLRYGLHPVYTVKK